MAMLAVIADQVRDYHGRYRASVSALNQRKPIYLSIPIITDLPGKTARSPVNRGGGFAVALWVQ